MSEETPKITTVKKEKDPKRVEAGKRLAAISKTAREKKMREKIKSEQTDESWNINYGYYLFGAIGVITAIGSLYYARKDDQREEKQLAKNNDDTTEKKHVVIKNDKINKLDSLE